MHVLRGVRLCLAGAQPQLLNLLWSQRHGSSNMDWSGRLYTPHSLARAPACEDHPIWGAVKQTSSHLAALETSSLSVTANFCR